MNRSLLLLIPFALLGCENGEVPCVDLSGTWTLEVSDVDSSCGPEDDWSSTLEITQEGCDATQIDVSGIKGDPGTVTGEVDGEVITISGSFEDAGGLTELTLTLSQDSETEFSGTEDWEWFASADDEEPTCTDGTAQVRLSKEE